MVYMFTQHWTINLNSLHLPSWTFHRGLHPARCNPFPSWGEWDCRERDDWRWSADFRNGKELEGVEHRFPTCACCRGVLRGPPAAPRRCRIQPGKQTFVQFFDFWSGKGLMRDFLQSGGWVTVATLLQTKYTKKEMTSTILTLVTFYAIVGKKNNRQPNLHFLHFLLLYQIIANVVVRCKSLTHGHNSSSVPRFGLIIKDNAGLTGHPFRLDRSAAA